MCHGSFSILVKYRDGVTGSKLISFVVILKGKVLHRKSAKQPRGYRGNGAINDAVSLTKEDSRKQSWDEGPIMLKPVSHKFTPCKCSGSKQAHPSTRGFTWAPVLTPSYAPTMRCCWHWDLSLLLHQQSSGPHSFKDIASSFLIWIYQRPLPHDPHPKTTPEISDQSHFANFANDKFVPYGLR